MLRPARLRFAVSLCSEKYSPVRFNCGLLREHLCANRFITRERLRRRPGPSQGGAQRAILAVPRDGARENTLTGWPQARQSRREKRFGVAGWLTRASPTPAQMRYT